MVAQFLRLKLRLLANTFRRSPIQIVGIAIGLFYGLGAAIVAVAGLIALRFVDTALAGSITVTLGALIVLGFLLVPLAFGVDDTLDPRAFSLFGISTTRLATALAVTALIGVPALVVAIIAVAQVVTWSRDPLAVVLAVIGAVVIVATCVLSARVTTSIAAFLLATRRAREITGLVALLIIVSLSPFAAILATVNWGRDGLRLLSSVAGVAGWTPLGAAWSAPAEAAAGAPGLAILKALIGIAFVLLLWVAWRGLVGWMLVTPQREARRRSYEGLGWFRLMPDTPAGAVAARSITYWLRDARYHTSLVAVPVAPLIFVVALAVAGVPWNILALIPVPAMCLFLSWSAHNDVAYDNSAVWLHIASNTDGRADRFGRLVPALIIGVPLVIVGAPICAGLFGDWAVLPSLIGVSFCLLFAGLGLSSVISARFPYPAVRPGDSPFAQPQASGTASGLIQSLSFFAAIVIALPPFGLAALGLAFGGGWNFGALLLGLVLGGAGLYFGVLWGGAIFTRRAPELLAFTLRN
ncbi:MAG: transporter permease [Microbacteriaceae bacterium]|nr:transporter permease [Microbacteriaceae bacterium]